MAIPLYKLSLTEFDHYYGTYCKQSGQRPLPEWRCPLGGPYSACLDLFELYRAVVERGGASSEITDAEWFGLSRAATVLPGGEGGGALPDDELLPPHDMRKVYEVRIHGFVAFLADLVHQYESQKHKQRGMQQQQQQQQQPQHQQPRHQQPQDQQQQPRLQQHQQQQQRQPQHLYPQCYEEASSSSGQHQTLEQRRLQAFSEQHPPHQHPQHHQHQQHPQLHLQRSPVKDPGRLDRSAPAMARQKQQQAAPGPGQRQGAAAPQAGQPVPYVRRIDVPSGAPPPASDWPSELAGGSGGGAPASRLSPYPGTPPRQDIAAPAWPRPAASEGAYAGPSSRTRGQLGVPAAGGPASKPAASAPERAARPPRRPDFGVRVGPHAQAAIPQWRPRPALSALQAGGGAGGLDSREALRLKAMPVYPLRGAPARREQQAHGREQQEQEQEQEQQGPGAAAAAEPSQAELFGRQLCQGHAPPQGSYAWWRAAVASMRDERQRQDLLKGALWELDREMGPGLVKTLGLARLGCKLRAEWSPADEGLFALGMLWFLRPGREARERFLPHKTLRQLQSYYYNVWKLRGSQLAGLFFSLEPYQRKSVPLGGRKAEQTDAVRRAEEFEVKANQVLVAAWLEEEIGQARARPPAGASARRGAASEPVPVPAAVHGWPGIARGTGRAGRKTQRGSLSAAASGAPRQLQGQLPLAPPLMTAPPLRLARVRYGSERLWSALKQQQHPESKEAAAAEEEEEGEVGDEGREPAEEIQRFSGQQAQGGKRPREDRQTPSKRKRHGADLHSRRTQSAGEPAAADQGDSSAATPSVSAGAMQAAALQLPVVDSDGIVSEYQDGEDEEGDEEGGALGEIEDGEAITISDGQETTQPQQQQQQQQQQSSICS